ncbi:uncharacterized protein LOC132702028 [Cylas formicarius]|uniref:uncharacterized protein LOC132702028 n=1 Tax=Cylas formicarius TaxID=197179 RepID=UPI002958A716|nr:uncharacterized protein LOC132702028 [Cylas formicarius]
MSDDETVPTCNCTKTLLAVKDLRSELEAYKTEVMIGLSCLSFVIAVLILCVIIIWFVRLKELRRIVRVLDPMANYERISPTTYVKKHMFERASISSSFHLGRYDEDGKLRKREKSGIEGGTLDKNFFTRDDFQFHNPLSRRENYLEDAPR